MQVTETLNEGLKRGYAITGARGRAGGQGHREARGGPQGLPDEGLPQGQGAGGADEEDVRQVGARRGDAGVDRPGDARAFRGVRRPAGAAARGQDDQRGLAGRPGRRGLDDLRGAAAGARGRASASVKLEKLVAEIDDAAVDEALENLAASANELRGPQEGRQGQGRRPGDDRLQGLGRRRGVRGRRGGGFPAGARLGQLHPRLRGAARRA